MNPEAIIRPIRAEEGAAARQLIYAVACPLIEPQLSLQEAIDLWEGWHLLDDLDDIHTNYTEQGGLFLVTVCDGKMVGTGAIRRADGDTCELTRLYFLPEYQGRGLGYAMMQELLRQARALGYRKVCLWTTREKQARAIDFYHRLGFVDVPHEGTKDYELWMELALAPADHGPELGQG